MPAIALPIHDAKDMARALLPHVSREKYGPPALGGVYIDAASQYAYATDRYTIGRYDLTNIPLGTPPGEAMWIPSEALSAVARLGRGTLLHESWLHYRVVFDVNKPGVTLRVERSLPDEPVASPDLEYLRKFLSVGSPDKFPPVSRLFDQFVEGEVSRVALTPEHMDKFSAYQKTNPMRIVFPAPGSETIRGKAILVEMGRRFKGLIQPVLLTNKGFGADLAADNRQRADAQAAAAQTPSSTDEGNPQEGKPSQ